MMVYGPEGVEHVMHRIGLPGETIGICKTL